MISSVIGLNKSKRQVSSYSSFFTGYLSPIYENLHPQFASTHFNLGP